jgi:hypothetical protein
VSWGREEERLESIGSKDESQQDAYVLHLEVAKGVGREIEWR